MCNVQQQCTLNIHEKFHNPLILVFYVSGTRSTQVKTLPRVWTIWACSTSSIITICRNILKSPIGQWYIRYYCRLRKGKTPFIKLKMFRENYFIKWCMVLRKHDVTNKNTTTYTKTMTNTFRKHLERAILETCDLWDICSQWWDKHDLTNKKTKTK